MRLKTKYRDSDRINPPNEKELPAEAVLASPPEAPTIAAQIEPKQPEPIPAVEALKAQLEALQRSEQIQRQQAAQLHQQPATREQKLQIWKSQGLSDAEARFLQQHPAMIDFPEVTGQAASEATQQGHQRDSQAFMEAMKVSFDNHLNRLRAQSPAEQPTPDFFKPPPPPAPPTRSNIVSAPVSREVPTGRPREENPRQVTLSAEEMEIAKASGISAAEYARGKLRLQREKASGERQ